MATARYLLIEGVTGAGKSSVISHLRAAPALADHVLVDEDETLGSLMDDVRDPTWRQALLAGGLDPIEPVVPTQAR